MSDAAGVRQFIGDFIVESWVGADLPNVPKPHQIPLVLLVGTSPLSLDRCSSQSSDSFNVEDRGISTCFSGLGFNGTSTSLARRSTGGPTRPTRMGRAAQELSGNGSQTNDERDWKSYIDTGIVP